MPKFGIAEVVGSTPTRSISFILVNYGTGLFDFGNCRTIAEVDCTIKNSSQNFHEIIWRTGASLTGVTWSTIFQPNSCTTNNNNNNNAFKK